MTRIEAGFNERLLDGGLFVLFWNGRDVNGGECGLVITDGERVVLFPSERDFEIEATIVYRYVEEVGRNMWVAMPDSATHREFDDSEF